MYFFDPGNDVVDIQEIGSGSNYVTQNDNKLYFIPRMIIVLDVGMEKKVKSI